MNVCDAPEPTAQRRTKVEAAVALAPGEPREAVSPEEIGGQCSEQLAGFVVQNQKIRHEHGQYPCFDRQKTVRILVEECS